MEGLFSFALLLLVVLIAVVVGALIYGAWVCGRFGEEPARRPSGAAPGGDVGSSTEVTAPPRTPHEYFKTMNPEAGEEMKTRLYSLGEYEGELDDAAAQPAMTALSRPWRPTGRWKTSGTTFSDRAAGAL